MAIVKQNGVTVNPGSGSGNTALAVKAEIVARGNRLTQTATFDVTATGVATPETFVANHLPAAEFVTFDNLEPAVVKGGGPVTITGTSNTTKITFTKGAGAIITADIANIKFTANGAEATNGVIIAGDPGAKAKYIFSLTLTAVANTTVVARNQQITATAAGGQLSTTILKQTAGDPTISVAPKTIDVPQDGSEVQVQVTTNTTFTVTPRS